MYLGSRYGCVSEINLSTRVLNNYSSIYHIFINETRNKKKNSLGIKKQTKEIKGKKKFKKIFS